MVLFRGESIKAAVLKGSCCCFLGGEMGVSGGKLPLRGWVVCIILHGVESSYRALVIFCALIFPISPQPPEVNRVGARKCPYCSLGGDES